MTEPSPLQQRIESTLRTHGMVHLAAGDPASRYDCCAADVLAELKPQLDAITRVRALARQIRAGAPWTANHDDLADRLDAALDGGLTVTECAANDRRWPLEKDGER